MRKIHSSFTRVVYIYLIKKYIRITIRHDSTREQIPSRRHPSIVASPFRSLLSFNKLNIHINIYRFFFLENPSKYMIIIITITVRIYLYEYNNSIVTITDRYNGTGRVCTMERSISTDVKYVNTARINITKCIPACIIFNSVVMFIIYLQNISQVNINI